MLNTRAIDHSIKTIGRGTISAVAWASEVTQHLPKAPLPSIAMAAK